VTGGARKPSSGTAAVGRLSVRNLTSTGNVVKIPLVPNRSGHYSGRSAVIPASYAKPPIVEAVVELRVSGGKPWKELEASLLAAFKPGYPGAQRQVNAFLVQTKWQNESIETSSRKDFLKWLLPDAKGLQLVGLGPGVFSLHVLAPYPGWAVFRPAVDRAFAQYCEVAKPEAVTEVGVRYIDQILLPAGGRLDDYFKATPPRLPSQPDGVTAFQITTESQDTATNTTSLLTLASGPQTAEGLRVVIYDLNLTRGFPTPIALAGWPENVEMLHKRQRDIFEESITDNTRELFK
jgi:uncharacterized protein (TIGR04255 family)